MDRRKLTDALAIVLSFTNNFRLSVRLKKCAIPKGAQLYGNIVQLGRARTTDSEKVIHRAEVYFLNAP
jgi:hypothetical protein